MKAAIFYGGKDIRVEELPVPDPGPGEVLVKVRSAGVCGSDLHYYHGDTPFGKRDPHQRGHELSGEVVTVGTGVTGLKAGERVGIEGEHLLGCGACRYCRRGDHHLCARRGYLRGERHESHGFSQYDVCLVENCHPLPESVTFDAAALVDCYACGVHALNRVDPGPTDTVVVLGTGAIGITLGQVAKAYGVGRVVMVGTRGEPLEKAKGAGAADEVIVNSRQDPVQAVLGLTGGEGADAIFETVGGMAPTINQGIGMARQGGVISILGIFPHPQEIDVILAYKKELHLQWSNSFSRWQGVSEYKTALGLIAAGRVQPNPLITHHFPLDQVSRHLPQRTTNGLRGRLK